MHDPAAQRYAGRPALTNPLLSESVTTKKRRNELIYQAHIEYGHKLNQIAEAVRLHYMTVSAVINAKDRNCLFKTCPHIFVIITLIP